MHLWVLHGELVPVLDLCLTVGWAAWAKPPFLCSLASFSGVMGAHSQLFEAPTDQCYVILNALALGTCELACLPLPKTAAL
jgi:hypothetical protein